MSLESFGDSSNIVIVLHNPQAGSSFADRVVISLWKLYVTACVYTISVKYYGGCMDPKGDVLGLLGEGFPLCTSHGPG